ncbi:acyl carrier protein [Kutzneria sp. 744]|uniref:acyl carrier protein n=1 Tax=Kutzneria sp. (strain 744) TaxID=345341 RepID=UPI0003EEB400|nr:acyl carrier protein [Kutzneria sp. 744]EWM10364.1 phosphopantetheine attachment site [Kutzneria sp. 744]
MAENDHTPEQIRTWLVDRVAHYLDRPGTEIDPDTPLAEYGLDSVYTFALCGEIEDTLGLRVEPTLLWDVDTLNALIPHLAGMVAERSGR